MLMLPFLTLMAALVTYAVPLRLQLFPHCFVACFAALRGHAPHGLCPSQPAATIPRRSALATPHCRSIVLQVPPSLVPPSQQQLPALRRVATAAPLAARQHLLLALHPRTGRCSALQLLPLPLVHTVMELVAPLAPCTIQVHAVDAGQQEE